MSNIKYDERGGIISLEDNLKIDASSRNVKKHSYSFLERLLLKRNRRLNYLLDDSGKYKCRNEKTPSVIRIGPTNRCTAQCFYCPRAHIHENGSGYMDFGMYEKIIAWAKTKGVREISFALFGEPLLHPRIFDMFELASRGGFRLRLSTNAIIMSADFADRILGIPFEVMEMSLDGYSNLEYEKGKMVNQYDRAKKNIEYLLAQAKVKKVKTKYNIHFVDAGNVSQENKINFVSYWKKQLEGLDYETSFYYEPHNWAGTRSEVAKNVNWFDKLLSKLEFKKPCIYIKGLNIDWNGNCIICTNDPTETAVIGNMNESDLSMIYNGEKRMKYLSAHESGDFRELNCAVCTVNSYWPLLFLKKRVLNYFS